MARRLNGPLQPETPSQTLFVRVVEDRFSLSLDSSGPALYKRGYKTGAARAPIRETLAAAILMTAGYDPARPLVDPMCGAGTFSLEAAMMAKHVAPGANRDFAFMGWPAFAANPWAFLKRQAHRQMVVLDRPRIFASDLDADAVAGCVMPLPEVTWPMPSGFLNRIFSIAAATSTAIVPDGW
ncbi:hypothetical protein [Desulfosarcina cetonica]|uniref:hypothetical protein n=1 Tax=Desulfosarcina cetonica TaxID=90730 RepID=UPI00155DD274|nr:hypothetical protein [Desulfosarcina cetonica]